MFGPKYLKRVAVCFALYLLIQLGGSLGSDSEPKEIALKKAAPDSLACIPGDLEECDQKCESGSGDSCVTLGTMYVNGQGVEVDREEAAALYQEACDLDSPQGCYALYSSYLYGVGIKQDSSRGLEFAKKACTLGHQDSCAIVSTNEQLGTL